jgi:hypothetical protein
VGGQGHITVVVTRGKTRGNQTLGNKARGNHCTGSWVDPRAILDGFHGIANPLPPPGGRIQTVKP